MLSPSSPTTVITYPVLKVFPKKAGEVKAETAERKATKTVRTCMIYLILVLWANTRIGRSTEMV
jgi:hypothetical protein